MDTRDVLNVNRIAAPVTALGPGTRVALWVQGCTIGCAGCASTDTWAHAAGNAHTVREVADRTLALAADTGATGLTVTGGEPFEQSSALAMLLDQIRVDPVGAGLDVLIFTGLASGRARRVDPALWAAADALVAGPYVRRRPGDGWLRASANQELVLSTARARERFVRPEHRPMDVQVTAHDVTMAGLPDPGDLERFHALMRARGIDFKEVSWQS